MGEGGYGDASGPVVGFDAGLRVAGYRLHEEIGRGGMAVVFRARDERLGRLVALKVLAPAYAADEGFRHRFIRESRAAAAVDDPHIVPVFEAGEADGMLFIAMRYVPGGDARSLVRREGPMPPARAVAVISPVASALDAAHAHGLLHRDVKPANMLVDVVPGRPDHVYLSDFGLSKGAEASTALTGAGHVTKGEVAQLYARRFPYTRAPVLVGSVILHPAGTTATYAFRVTPILATRYTVEVFGSSTAATPLATSPSRTIYVATGGSYGNAQTCTRPVCHETLPVHVLVPASALSTEISKPWYVYFNISLSAGKVPLAPKVLLLNAGGARVTAPQPVSAGEFERTITLSFTVGNDAYNWNWTSCNQDTEAQDGMGLPGRHGCGAGRVDVSASYLG